MTLQATTTTGTIITRTLYGTITPARQQFEQFDLERRAIQLSPLTDQEKKDVQRNFDFAAE